MAMLAFMKEEMKTMKIGSRRVVSSDASSGFGFDLGLSPGRLRWAGGGPMGNRNFAKYTIEGEGYVQKRWRVFPDVVDQVCTCFNEALFDTLLKECGPPARIGNLQPKILAADLSLHSGPLFVTGPCFPCVSCIGYFFFSGNVEERREGPKPS